MKKRPIAYFYPKFKAGDKVLIVSADYHWGIVESVKPKSKDVYLYKIKFANNKETREIPEEGIMKYMPKWLYKLRTKFSWIVW